ncbi:MAG TPA: hypothetical protein VLB04_07915, partial [Methanotrichaceae archaeon]|nr:hypothetical protein [Methanotrichaceae archaeon]
RFVDYRLSAWRSLQLQVANQSCCSLCRASAALTGLAARGPGRLCSSSPSARRARVHACALGGGARSRLSLRTGGGKTVRPCCFPAQVRGASGLRLARQGGLGVSGYGHDFHS